MKITMLSRRLAGVAAALALAGCANFSGIEPEAKLRETVVVLWWPNRFF